MYSQLERTLPKSLACTSHWERLRLHLTCEVTNCFFYISTVSAPLLRGMHTSRFKT
jgi:hypothetical protein